MRRLVLTILCVGLAGCAGQTPPPSRPPSASVTDREFKAAPEALVPLIASALTAQGFKIVQSTPASGFVQGTRESKDSGLKSMFSSLTLGYPKNKVETTATAMVRSSSTPGNSTVHLSAEDIVVDANARPIETHPYPDETLYSKVWDSVQAALPASPAK